MIEHHTFHSSVVNTDHASLRYGPPGNSAAADWLARSLTTLARSSALGWKHLGFAVGSQGKQGSNFTKAC